MRMCSGGFCGKGAGGCFCPHGLQQLLPGHGWLFRHSGCLWVCGIEKVNSMTFKSKVAPQREAFLFFFFDRMVGWAMPGRVVSSSPVGRANLRPYLQPAQKSPELCSLSLWKRRFQSSDGLAVCARAAVPSCQACEIVLLCETSNGGKGAMVIEVTVSSHVVPKVSGAGHSHPSNFLVLQFITVYYSYQALTFWGASWFFQLKFANSICFPLQIL